MESLVALTATPTVVASHGVNPLREPGMPAALAPLCIGGDHADMVYTTAIHADLGYQEIIAFQPSRAAPRQLAQFPLAAAEHDANGESPLLVGVVRHLSWMPELDGLIVMLRDGAIYTLPDAAADAPRAEASLLGHVPEGILAATWSPDGDVLALVSGTFQLLLMTLEFDVVKEMPLETTALGEDQPVVLGWGKKETQFHGQAGKAEAARQHVVVPERDAHDVGAPVLTWRSDGRYLAVSYNTEGGRGPRRVQIYDREGTYRCAGEPMTCLGQTLAWRPPGAGTMMAATQTLPHRQEVIFIELNGLRHGEFTIRQPTLPVGTALGDSKPRTLFWNVTGQILGLWLEHSKAGTHTVQLWASRNYYWYLHQVIDVPGRLQQALFDPTHPMRLHTVHEAKDGAIVHTARDFAMTMLVSRQMPHLAAMNAGEATGAEATDAGAADAAVDAKTAPDAPAWAAVVDGASVKLTPFRYSNVPPPMAAATYTLGADAEAVQHVSARADGAHAAVLTTRGRVHLVATPPLARPCVPTLLGVVALAPAVTWRQVSWPSASVLVVLGTDADGADIVHVMGLAASASVSPPAVTHTATLRFDRPPAALTALQDEPACGCLVLHDAAGHLYTVTTAALVHAVADSADGTTPPASAVPMAKHFETLPAGCEVFRLARMPALDDAVTASNPLGNCIGIGLTRSRQLYVNGTLMSAQCTSIALHPQFLLFTSTQHLLHFVPIDRLLTAAAYTDDAEKPAGGPAEQQLTGPARHALTTSTSAAAHTLGDDKWRRVERGARLVAVVPELASVVLQMPRGNLETIYPRPLVVNAVKRQIQQRDYRAAFMNCRRHRVDTNLLYMEDPQQFMAMLPEVIRQLGQVDLLNLLISNLCRSKSIAEINPVSNAIIDALQSSAEPAKYTQSVLTAMVGQRPPALERALHAIQSIKTSQSAAFAEGALAYLMFLVDPEELYHEALGLYDYDLVLMVAQQTQKDPREYLAFLKELAAKPPALQRFAIDTHLKRYVKALGHLVHHMKTQLEPTDVDAWAAAWPQLREYVTRHRLHREAIRHFVDDAEVLRSLYALFAVHLVETNRSAEAGEFYRLAELDAEAAQQFAEAMDWQAAMVAAMAAHAPRPPRPEPVKCPPLVDRPPPDLHALAETLRSRLDNAQRYDELAQLILDQPRTMRCVARLQHSTAMSTTTTSTPTFTPTTTTVATNTVTDAATAGAGTTWGPGDEGPAPVDVLPRRTIDDAVIALLNAQQWVAAERIALLHHQPDVIATLIRPEVASTAQRHLDRLTAATAQTTNYADRLVELRRKAAEREVQLAAATAAGGDLEAVDVFSDTASMMTGASRGTSLRTGTTGASTWRTGSSMHSRKSHMSARQRRRDARKRHSDRPGGVYEEEFLLMSLFQLAAQHADAAWRQELVALGPPLVRYGYMATGDALAAAWAAWTTALQSALDRCLPPPPAPPAPGVHGAEEAPASAAGHVVPPAIAAKAWTAHAMSYAASVQPGQSRLDRHEANPVLGAPAPRLADAAFMFVLFQ